MVLLFIETCHTIDQSTEKGVIYMHPRRIVALGSDAAEENAALFQQITYMLGLAQAAILPRMRRHYFDSHDHGAPGGIVRASLSIGLHVRTYSLHDPLVLGGENGQAYIAALLQDRATSGLAEILHERAKRIKQDIEAHPKQWQWAGHGANRETIERATPKTVILFGISRGRRRRQLLAVNHKGKRVHVFDPSCGDSYWMNLEPVADTVSNAAEAFSATPL